MIAPEPYLTACLAIVQTAILACRAGLRSGDLSPARVADMPDRVHNVPELIQDWEAVDLDQLAAELRGCDTPWTGGQLLSIFERALKEPARSTVEDDRVSPAAIRSRRATSTS